MQSTANDALEALRYTNRGYSLSELAVELQNRGLSSSEISLQLLDALSASKIVEEEDAQLRLSDRELSGW